MEEDEGSAGSLSRVVVSEPAFEDINRIWLHIAADNIQAADRIVAEFEARFALLSALPDIGHARPDRPAAVRCFPVGNYLIIYQHLPGELRIVRVLHGARLLEGLF